MAGSRTSVHCSAHLHLEFPHTIDCWENENLLCYYCQSQHGGLEIRHGREKESKNRGAGGMLEAWKGLWYIKNVKTEMTRGGVERYCSTTNRTASIIENRKESVIMRHVGRDAR